MLERTVKLLIVRNDKIGDFILILPALSWIKKNLPNSKVVCLVSKEIHELAENCQFVDEVVDDTKIKNLKNLLAGYEFDASISFFSTFRIGYLLKKLDIPIRIAPKTKLAQFFYNYKLKQKRSKSLKPEYEYNIDLVNVLFEALNMDDIKDVDGAPYMTFNPETIQKRKLKFIQEYNLDVNKKIIFLHPGTGGSSKGLSIESFSKICNGLRSFDDYNFLIHCSESEEDLARELKMTVDKNVRIRVIEPKPSILNMVNNISICDIFIAGSTGPLHIAGALNKKTIGFYPRKTSSTSLRWQSINSFDNRMAFSDIGKDKKNISIENKKIILEIQKFITSV